MPLKDILVWVNIGLILALMLRVIALNLKGVFRLLILVLGVNLVFLGLTYAMRRETWVRYHLDYRVVFALDAALELTITGCIVFALLRSFMSQYPGILKLSRRVLWIIVFAAAAVGLVVFALQVPLNAGMETQAKKPTPETAKKRAAEQRELEAAKVRPSPTETENRLRHSVFLMEAVDQTVSAVLLFTLLSMLVYLLWFPVDVPRNIVIFSAGYIIFFAVKSLTLFFRYFSSAALTFMNISVLVVTAGCCLYWLFFLTASGDVVPVRLGHRWKPQEQERLLDQLGAINTTLLRSARRH